MRLTVKQLRQLIRESVEDMYGRAESFGDETRDPTPQAVKDFVKRHRRELEDLHADLGIRRGLEDYLRQVRDALAAMAD